MLSRMSGSPRAVVTTLIVVGLTIYFGERVTALLGAPMAYIIAWNSLALIHFYIDGLVWAFRNPFVRQSVGPYLMPDSRIRPV
jgi:hypothetical protein